MKLQKVFILTMLLAYLKASCGSGCLSCNAKSECLLCDFQYAFHYQPDTGKCIRNEISYCVTYDLNGNCLKCKAGFYTEPNSLKCIEIPSSIYDPNCAVYNYHQQCEQCIEGHYSIGKSCQEIATPLDNCMIYKSAQHCQQCKDGYIPTLQQDKCIAVPNVNNCQTYTTIKCSKCQSNASKVHDFLKSQVKLEINQQDIKTLDTIINKIQSKTILAEDSCLFSKIEHCLSYSGFNICSLCDTGYFLSEGLCIPSPKEIIPNCQDYLNEKVCKRCIQGYYLLDQSNCKQILDTDKVQFCAEYDGTLNQPVCQRCINSHFLNNSTCQQRQSLADKCIEYHIDQDKCKSCESNDLERSVTSDGKKCLPSTNFCSVYETSSITSTKLECNTCQQGYYLNDNTLECVKGNILNCKIYKRILNECQVCQNKYYLKDNQCLQHVDLANCDQYDPSVQDSCQQCTNQSIKLEQINKCIKVDLTGCQVYETENRCQTCQDGYNLSTDKKCILLSNSSHCLRAVDNVCIKCISGYFLKDELCHEIFEYEQKNCYLSSQQGQSGQHLSQECEVCIDYSIPYNLKDQYVCLRATELTSIFNENQFFVNNCSVYKNDNNSIKCSKCNRGFRLDNNECVNTCGVGQGMSNISFIKTNNKINFLEQSTCITLDAGVDSIALNKSFETTPYKLKDTHQYRIYYNRPSVDYKLLEPSQLPGNPQSSDLYQLHMHRDIVEVEEFSRVDQCEYYELFHDDIYRCQNCKFGYFGEIVNFTKKINNCFEYNTNGTCKLCQHKYKLNTTKFKCVLSEINHCEQYEINTANCLTCEHGYYRTSLTACAENTSTNCMFKDKFDNTCIRCKLYYLRSPDKSKCYEEIDNCITHNVTDSAITCDECKIGYHPNTAKTACTQGTLEFCNKYDQTQQNTCEYFLNLFEVNYNTQCTSIPKRYGCHVYSNDFKSCTYCQQNKYYYSNEGKCCDPGTYPTSKNNVSQECQGKETTNKYCKKWTFNTTANAYKCSECYENYHLSNGTQCCHIGEYYDTTSSKCKDLMSYNDSNTLNCTLFDINERICHGCTGTKYVNKNKCCDLGEYNLNDTCTTITQVANCAKLDDNLTTCLECSANYTLKNNVCCNLSTHIFHLNAQNNTICYTKPTTLNCISYESSFTAVPVLKCKQCTDNTYYMVTDNIACCKKGTDTVTAQFWDTTANTNSGGCVDVPTADIVPNCEIYNSSKACTKCQEDASPAYFLQHNGKCCKSGLNQDGTDCLQTSRLYDNCLTVSKSNTSYCTECKDGYYKSNGICVQELKYFSKTLTSQNLENLITSTIVTVDNTFSANCIKMSDDKSKCTACKDGYFLPSATSKICCKDDQVYINNTCKDKSSLLATNCMYLNPTNVQCAKSDTNAFFNFGFCQADSNIHYYIVGASTKCCKLGQKDNSGTCEANMLNCQVQEGTNCKQCKDGFKNLTTSCPALPNNCLESNAANDKCTKCKEGYQYKTTVGTCDTPANISLTFSTSNNCMGITENATVANSTCVNCQAGYYLTSDHCCKWSQYYKTTQCLNFTDKNCAEGSETGGTETCTHCFTDTNHCYNYNKSIYKFKPTMNSIYFEDSIQDIPIGIEESFDIQKDTCCKKGTYKKNGDCIDIPSDSNCLFGIDNSGTFNCKKCKDGYHSSSGKCCILTQSNSGGTCQDDNKTCVDRLYDSTLTGDDNKLYLSNNKCCRQHFYYDNDKEECLPHPDPNCLKSNSSEDCLTCKSITLNTNVYTMKPSKFYIKAVLNQEGGKNCEDKEQVYYFKPCILNKNTTDDSDVNTSIIDANYIGSLNLKITNCKIDSNLACTECLDGYYLKDGYCCKYNEFHKDGICINKDKVLQQCVNFNPSTYECEQCQIGYELTYGLCCPKDHFFDSLTMQCLEYPEFCDEYVVSQRYCKKCLDGSYQQDGHCCPYGMYYDLDNDECQAFMIDTMEMCKKGTKDECSECYNKNTLDSESIYINLTNKRCCLDGYYYNTTDKKCKEITNEPNCVSIDSDNKCLKCEDDYYLDNKNSKCCPYGFLYNTGTSQCDLKIINCIKTYWDSTTPKCSECEDNYYLSNDHCCQDDYYYNTTSQKCVKLYYETLINCKIPAEQEIDNKLYCKECKDNFYLNDEIQLNGSGFTKQNKTVCCPDLQVYDPSQKKCVTIASLTTNDYIPTTATDCNRAHYFQVGGTTYAFCMECITSQVLEIVNQSTGFDTIDSNTKKVGCKASAGQHNNCSTVLVTGLTDNDNLGCLRCSNQDTTYLSDASAIKCCNKGVSGTVGQYYDGSNNCTDGNDNGCEQFQHNSADQCEVCLSGFFIDSTTTPSSGCTAETPEDGGNCLQKQAGGDNNCLQCNKSYFLQNVTTCSQITDTTIFDITECSANSNFQCVACFDSNNLSNGGCCANEQFYDPIGQACQAISGYEGCSQYSNSNCLKCVNTSEYVTSGKCCPVTKKWNNTSCVDITFTGTDIQDCNKVDTNGNCIECVTAAGNYISNGRCCALNKYYNGTSCVDISTTTYPDCNQFQDKCSNCSTGILQDDKCCGNRYWNGVKCDNVLGNCEEMKNDGKCKECIEGYYLTDGNCCRRGQVYLSNACTDITTSSLSTLTNCIQVSNPTASSPVCNLCKEEYHVTNGKCCKQNQYYDKVSSSCIEYKFIENCAQLNNEFVCTKCITDYYLSTSKCCKEGYYYNTTNKKCEDITEAYCLQQNNGSRCSKCMSGYYVNPVTSNTNQCCRLGMSSTNANCQDPEEDLDNPNCIKFDTSGNCSECESGYTKQQNVCCKAGHVVFGTPTSQQDCIDINKLYENCDNFNSLTLKCTTCKDNYYITDSSMYCCADNKHYVQGQGCVDNYEGCKKQDSNNCLTCKNSTDYLNGKTGQKRCCPKGQYVNHKTTTYQQCVDIDIDNCSKAHLDNTNNLICDECFNGELQKNHCCLEGTIYDAKKGACVDEIENCKNYKYNTSNEIECKECDSGFTMINNSKQCCKDHQFYFTTDSKCTKNIGMLETKCQTIDKNTYACTSCQVDHYLSNSICCPYTKYFKTTDTKECTGVILTDYSSSTNCIAHDRTNCLKCKDGYMLSTSKSCVQIYDNCADFNPNTPVCNACSDNYYITDGHCCEQGKKYITNACSTPTSALSNCLRYNDGSAIECTLCKQGYYVTTGKYCCKNGKYCSSSTTEVDGAIKKCREYGSSTTNCLQCNENSTLALIADTSGSGNVSYCLHYSQENCWQSSFVSKATATIKNHMKCNKCKDFYEATSVTAVELNIVHSKVENCAITNTKEYIEDSQIVCVACKADYYLNGQVCTQRTAQTLVNCRKTHLTQDKCIECIYGYNEINGNCVSQITTNCQLSFTSQDNSCDVCKDNKIETGSNTDGTVKTYTCTNRDNLTNYLTEATPPQQDKGHINNCEHHHQCTDKYLNGLDTELSKLLSCHVCNDTDRIPFVSIKFEYTAGNANQNEIGIQQYDYHHASEIGTLDDNRKNHSSECIKIDLSEINFTNTVDKTQFPRDCGIGMINPDETTTSLNQVNATSVNLNTSKLSIFCVACKPGFKPTYSNVKYHVPVCTAINNCNLSGNSFNQCDQCSDGYAFNYVSGQGIDKSTCVQITTSQVNCYTFDSTNSKCMSCMKGFQLNLEGFCELLEVPYCEHGKSNKLSQFETHDWQLAYYRGDIGCQQCQSGFYRLLRQVDDYVCLVSQYARDNSFLTTDPILLKDCQKYKQTSNGLKCYQCAKGSVIDVNDVCVTRVDNLKDCEIAATAGSCSQCPDNLVLVSPKCVQKSIEFCKDYFNDKTTLTCKQCVNGYYLLENQCLQGQIEHCGVYTDKDNCSKCIDGYQQITTSLDKKKCVQVSIKNNCYEFDGDKFQDMKIECNQCTFGHILKTLTEVQKVCVPLPEIDGCEVYDKGVNFQGSTLHCNSCQKDYYMQENKCFKRLKEILNCSVYEISKDSCHECRPGYYVVDEGLTCEPEPQGIFGCEVYLNLTQCSICKSAYYLSENLCVIVPDENLVENCSVYNTDITCQKCSDNFILLENACVNPEVQNCSEYLAKDNCGKCNYNFKLVKSDDDKGTCVEINILENCSVMQQVEPYGCDVCKAGHFYNEESKKCESVSVDKQIKNCLEYTQDFNCKLCQDDYALSVNKRQCVEFNYDSNCQNFEELGEPICVGCQQGYTINGEYECVEDSSKSFANCLVTRLNDDKVCGVCMPGFYMDEKFICEKGLYDKEEPIDNNESEETEVELSGQPLLLLILCQWIMIISLY